MDSSKLVRISIRTNLKFLLPFVNTAFPLNEVIKVDPLRSWKDLLRSYKIPVQDKHIINSGKGIVSGISTQVYHHIRKIRHVQRRKNRAYIVRVGIDSSKKVYGVQKTIPAPLKRKLKQQKLVNRQCFSTGGMYFKPAENNAAAKKSKLVAPKKILKLKAKWKVPGAPHIPSTQIQQVKVPQPIIAEFEQLRPSSHAKDNVPIQRELPGQLGLASRSSNSNVSTDSTLSLSTVDKASLPPLNDSIESSSTTNNKSKDKSSDSNDVKSAVLKSLMSLSNSDFWRMKKEFKESKRSGKYMSIMQHMRGMDYFITVALDGKNFSNSSLPIKKAVLESITETHNNSMLRRMKKYFDAVKREYCWYQITSYVPTIVHMLGLILDDENFSEEPKK